MVLFQYSLSNALVMTPARPNPGRGRPHPPEAARAGYFPLKTGFRFSLKLRIPSIRSSVPTR